MSYEYRVVNEFNKHDFKLLYKRVKKEKNFYIDCIATFDSETSHIGDTQGWIYQWALLVGSEVYIGRKPSEFIEILKSLENLYKLGANKKMVVYVHNLSYDYQYIVSYINDNWSDLEIFAMDSHKILSLKFGGFEFRCSYLLSNMSLDMWSTFLKCENRKKLGYVDYHIIRYQDSYLTKKDDCYLIGDVVTLAECISKMLEYENDTLVTIPLTSTGYVRRDARKACRNVKYRDFFIKTKLEVDTYAVCNQAFAGGYTHVNRFFVNKCLFGKIRHFDKKSFYPSVQQLNYFPVSKFELLYDYKEGDIKDWRFFDSFRNEYCCLIEFFMENCKIKKGVTAPYLQKSKLIGGERVILDNGRILNFQGVALYTCTELDLDIIERQYEFTKLTMKRIYISKRGRMPEELRNVVNEYFTNKENLDKETYFYAKSKNRLNSIYGMTATNIIRDGYTFNSETLEIDKDINMTEDFIKDMLQKYYKSRNNFMPYQFGVWTTSHCRHQLFELIEKIGYENFIYSDTDSIFFYETEENINFIERHNSAIIEKNKELGLGVKNRDGGISYYCTFEDEKDNIYKFKALHSKCYAFIDKSEKLHATIAGVAESNKKIDDLITKEMELSNLANLTNDFTFHECGGTRIKYIYDSSHIENINGHETEVGCSALILKVEKTLSDMKDWEKVIEYDEVY